MRRQKSRSGPHPKGYVPPGVKPHQWKKGQSGNPKGAPKGRKWTRTRVIEAINGNAGDFLEKLREIALDGNVPALKAIMAPLIAQAQDNPIRYKWTTKRESAQDLIIEGNAVLDAVSRGELTLREAEALSKILERQRQAVESATAGDRRNEFELDEKILDKIRQRPRLFALAVRLLEFYQSALDAEDMARAHPITVLPRAIAVGKTPSSTESIT
jgi:hypothetical protein